MLLTNWLRSIASKCRSSRPRTFSKQRSRSLKRYQTIQGRYRNLIEQLEDRTLLTSLFSIDDVSFVEGDAGTSNVVLTVSRTGAAPGDLNSIASVDFTTADATATTVDADYVSQGNTLNFAADPSSTLQTQTISIQVNGDVLTEENETFEVHLLNNSTGTSLDNSEATVTILNDDQSTLSINDITVNEFDGTASVVVSLDNPIDTEVSFDFLIFDETANNPDDYLAASGSMTFAPGELSKTINVPIVDSNLVESTETFLVSLSNIQTTSSNLIVSDTLAKVRILDDDQAIVSIDDVSVNENDGTAMISVSLNHPVDTAISVDFMTADQSALTTGDYIAQTGTLIFNPGVQSQTITVPLSDDNLVEGNETFLVNLTNLLTSDADVIMGDPQATVTILDDDEATIAIDDISVDESDGTATLTVSLDQPVATTVSVDFATADQSAASPDDYTSQTGTLIFNPGEQSHTIIVDITDNNIVEADEIFFVNLSNILSNGANITFADEQSEVTILNDDQANISIDDISVNENDGTATLTVSLDQPVATTVTVDFDTLDELAVAPDDYTTQTGTLTFTPGVQSQTIVVDIIDDVNIVEGDETFFVNLSNIIANGFNVLMRNSQAEVTIIDDEQATISINDISVNENDGTATLTVSLDQPVTTTVTIDFATADQSAASPDDYTAQTGTLTFNPGVQSQTIDISIDDDNLVEDTELFLVSLADIQANGANITFADDQGEITIQDNDQASISIDDITVNENDGTATLTVSFDQPVDTTVTVDFATADQSALNPTDYTAQTGTLTFTPGVQSQTIVVDIIDDVDIIEGDEIFFVNLSNIMANGFDVSMGDAEGTVTIIDDEIATISIDDVTVNENDGTATLTVSLDQPVATTVNVDFDTVDQSAVSPDDYTTQMGTLTFTPGVQSQTIVVDNIDDLDIVEGIETFLVNLTNIQASGANITFADDQGEITILDDEATTIAIDDVTVNENDGTATLTVTLDQLVATTVTVDFATLNQLAVDPDDYTAQSGTITFNPGEQSQSIIISIVDDTDLVEPDETFLVNLTNIQASGANITFADDQGEITIQDNDQASISIDDITVNENDGTATLTVSLDQPVATTVTVEFTTADQSAIELDDYTAQTGTLTFNPGVQSQQILVSLIDDDLVENDETFQVDLTAFLANGADVIMRDNQAIVTIQDDDQATISIDDISVNENDGTATLTVSLDQPVDEIVTVEFTTADQSAIELDDYTAQTGTLTFNPGVQSQTIIVPIINDLDIVEADETFQVDLTAFLANGADVVMGDDQAIVTIFDDEQASISIDDVTVNENDGTATLTVTLDQPVATTVTVNFATDNLTAVDPDDYTAQSGTITFNPGEQSQSIIISIVDDTDLVEPDETFLVNLTNIQASGANITFADDQGEITIQDNDQASISIDDITVNENDGTATLTVSLDQPVATTVTVEFTTADQSAIELDDYTAQTGTLTFNPGVQSQQILVSLIDDDLVENDETFQVDLTAFLANGADVIMGDNQAIVTIQDDDQATISIDDISVNENDGTATLTVSLDQPVDEIVTVEFATADQSAIELDDYTAQTGTLTFNPGVQSQTIIVPIINDLDIVEADETFQVDLTAFLANGADVIMGDNQAIVTIFDDEQASISIDDVTVNENDGTATLTVSLDQPVATTVTVDFATDNLTAFDPDDYTTQTGTLTFNPGEQSQSIIISIVDNNIVEGDERFLVDLSNIMANGANVTFADAQAEVTILDNESASFSINNISVNEDAGTAMLTVSLDFAVDTAISVDYTTTNLTAVAPDDYSAQTGTLTFNPGEQSHTIAVNIIDDNLVEDDESILISLSNIQNGENVTFSNSLATVLIEDNDQAIISISDLTVNENNGTATLTVSLDQPVDTTVTVDFATDNQTAFDPGDYTTQTGTVTFDPGVQSQTIIVDITDDVNIVEGDESFLLNLTNLQPNGADVIMGDNQAEVTILDNEATTISIDDVTVNENDGTATLTVTLDQPVATTVTVDFATDNLTAFDPDDYTAQTGTLTFNPGEQSQTIVLDIIDNIDIVEGIETFLVNLSNIQASGANITFADDQGEVTILDDEATTIDIDDVTVNENDGTATLTVTLDQPVATTVTVDFATANQLAVDPDDYTAQSGTLTFNPGEQSQTIIVDIIDDLDIVEGIETFLVNLTNIQASGANITFADDQGEVTILDDEQATIDIDDVTVNENDGTATLTVTLDQPVATTVTVDFATANQLAVDPDDYTAQTGTLTFNPGEQSQTIIVDIIDDLDIVEGIETFLVNLTNIQASGANITFADDQGEVTILDDEQATINIDDVTVNENDGTATLTVTLDQPVATTVTVDFATDNLTAFDPDDYTAQTGTLTFNPGEQSQTIIVDIIDNIDIVEGIETFLVNLSNIQASGANITFADDQGEVTILDDEATTIDIDDVTVNENDGTATLTVTLDQPVATTVTVDFATANQLAVDPDDYTAQTGTLTFNPGEQSQTIIVDIIDDLDIVEGIETFLVNLTNIQASGANITFDDDQGEVTILDDEATTIDIDDVTVNENDGTATLTVTLDQPVATTVTVDFATDNLTAFDPDDYTAQTGTLTFNPGEQSQTIIVDIIDDLDIVEGIETFLVNLTNIQASGANITFADDQGEVTILDDEQATIDIDDVTVNENDGTATLTVTLDQPVATTVNVDFATADQLAVDPDDYTAQSGTLTFNAGMQSQEIIIDITDTALVEFTESFLVNLSNIQANGANITFADNQGEVTILDDDQSNLTISDLSIDEMDGTAVLTVSLDSPVDTAVSIDFITDDQSALNSIDYLFQSGSLTFNPGEQSKSITITILDNAAVEFDETFFVTLSNLQTSSSDVILADDQAEVTIVDDDQSTFSITDITVNEDAGTATVLVSLDQPVDTTVTVDFATVDNSATNPTDYLHHTGTLVFTLGEQPQTITIPIIDTDDVELTESFFINLSNIQANGLDVTFADSQSEITITDDDQTTISINDISVNEDIGTATLTVSLDQPVGEIITVDFETVDQTATGPEDYLSQTGTLTFNPGEQTQTITIPIVNNDLVELSEFLFVNLSNLQTNGTDVILTDDQGEVTIFDDDQARISIDDIFVDEDSGFATLTVSLDSPVDTTVNVDFATTDQTAIDLEDYVATSGTINFSPGEQSKTITISIIDSFLLEADETFLVNLTNLQANGRNVLFADNQAEVTIVDDIIASANIDLRVVNSPTNTQPNGEVNLLPENQDSITEWSSYWVEIWVNASSPTNQGIFSVELDLNYHTEFTSATDIEFGASFSQNQAGTINDALGTVEGLFAETNASELGIAGHLLFARIKFEPLAEDQVELDLPGRSIGPYDLGFNINSQQVHLDGNIPVTTNLVEFAGADIWANPFDLDDDDAINFKDLMLFASVYQTIPSESASDLSWFADYNQNNSVDFKDLNLFVSNYNKSKLGQTAITYPQNFPEAWNNPLIADTSQAEPQTSPVSLSQSAADSVLDGVVEYVSPQLTPSQNETLENIDIEIVNLTGNTLGRAVTGTIYIDVNAAGYGWFIDDTPGDHSEFEQSSHLSLIALPDSDAAGRVDLWSVIMHELGHLLGYDHEAEGVMQETLAPGIRNLPSWELNIDLGEHSTPEEADSFFLTIQNETELVPF
ncbi:Calx-beta domain-containing protein [Gimesia aquarii]|uniref:50S ribosomal protein L24 n=1 Tax=Gimesia aquarii TaxID=2527964 RepID=A0A517VWA2_9PLAN|nr:Calx-beta domain-containing protein [Gimesia aquarii]QDT97284.1 50S ribosomal protein L24 [Gimesia aquarii]